LGHHHHRAAPAGQPHAGRRGNRRTGPADRAPGPPRPALDTSPHRAGCHPRPRDLFVGRLADRPAFTDWLKNSYLPSYPTPARHAYFDPDAAEAAGFAAPSYDEGEILVPLTCAQLADYLLSQSNAAIAMESGHISAEALRDQIINETSAFFPDRHPTDVVFGVRVWTTVLRK